MIPDDLLRDVLEFALEAFRQSERTHTGVAIPKQVRPLLRFKKLNNAGLTTMRRTLEDQEAIRRAVSEGMQSFLAEASGPPVEPVALLWLQRPEGWEAEAERYLAEYADRKRLERLAIEERGAEKRLAAAERHLATAREEVVRLGRELADEKRRRDEAVRRAREAERVSGALEQRLSEAQGETRRAKQAAESAQQEAGDARLALSAAHEVADALRAEVERMSVLRDEALRARAAADEQLAARDAGPDAGIGVDPAALGVASQQLQEAADALNRAMGTVSAAAAAAATRSHTQRKPLASQPRDAQRPRRKPIAIPGGRYGDDVEVATFLLASPGIIAILDGYNVAMTAWPDATLEEQRERLVAAAEDVVRRVGTRVRIVFDGADLPSWRAGRRLVSVEFSEAGVIADDSIRNIVDTLPAEQHIVVVTSDNALTASVRALGANTINSAQFLAAIGR